MGFSGAFRVLGRFLEPYEEMGSLSTVDISMETGRLHATLELAIECAALTLDDSRVADDGRIQVTFETPGLDDPTDDLELETTDSRLEGDHVVVTIAASIPTETTAPEPAAPEPKTVEETREVPPFRDRELLAEVYETYDTFAAMKDALGMDVTAETVRRYMVDYGIHEPNTYNTDRTEDDTPSKPIIADGIGLPEDVTVESFIETVRRSNTIYEVKQGIGIERDDAIEMLKSLNLLDLVVGRLATESEREITREEVVERLRAASA